MIAAMWIGVSHDWSDLAPANEAAKPSSPWDFDFGDYWGAVSDERQARAEERARIREEQ